MMQETTGTFETNGNLPNSKDPNNSAENSSDESIHSKDADTCCLRRQSNNSRESEQGRSSEDKPSFSSIVDRRDRKGVIPLFFERASGNLLNPSFDSETLESEFQRFSVNVDKSRFQIAVIYIAFACIILAIYFGIERNGSNSELQVKLSVGAACAGLISMLLFVVTKFVKLYSRPIEARTLSIIVSLLYAAAMVASFFVLEPNDLNYGARFGLASCLIIVIYTMMPALPLYGSLILALGFSIAYEVCANMTAKPKRDLEGIAGVILLHVCTHTLGYSIVFMAQIRRRSTFWRVGQSVVATQDLDIEQRVKKRMIKSVMPKQVAEFLIKEHIRPGNRQRSVAFRPFTMYKMENVSILFADIVGFTKMSAKKEADHLVQLLNMLFGKFDELTELNNCEKISTLGDCYYCVAGCPELSEHHAISCVEMGLDIIEEIKNFCQETKEDVDMRVGIHTGNVLCGIVGDKRRRFDVWSNDVNLANKMESAGKPGRVHITEKTRSFLNDLYTVEDGAGIVRPDKEGESLNSYFIVERKDTLMCKPWKKDGDVMKNSIMNNLQDAHSKNDGHKNKLSEAKIADTEDVRLEGVKSSNFVVADDTLEKTFLAKRSLSPTLSPAKGNLQKQLIKTPLPFPATFNFTYGITLNEALRRDAMRASNDNQLVKLMHEKKIQKEYFFNPPLNVWSLNFKDGKENREEGEENDIEMSPYGNANSRDEKQQSTEKKYRDEGFKGFKLNPKVITFASPKVHFMFDVATCAVTLFITVIAGLLLFHENLKEHGALITVIIICLMAMLCLLVYQCMKFSPSRFPKKISKCAAPPDKEISENGSTEEGPNSIAFQDAQNHNRSPIKSCDTFKKKLLSPWITTHLVGGVIMCLPIIVVFAFYQDCDSNGPWSDTKAEYFTMLTLIALFHFCSFTQLSYLMKNLIACAWCLIFVLVLIVQPTACIKPQTGNPTEHTRSFIPDIVTVVILQIVLVSVLNRIHEKGVRANFYGDKEAAEQKNNALEQKQVADWLIQDMFPRHVSAQLKYTKHCSKNYDMVGVLFASIVNFSEFYEENFAGGLECIRVLHELVGDFDKELMKYLDIEKIKTVYGTTFMAASGLNVKTQVTAINQSAIRSHKFFHLKSLVDFALGLHRTLNEFNSNMLGFRFRLRCGINAGPVTAGVIGTMKPQYDVWGDTVNLASRMDSTGVEDRVQVDEDCMKKLTDFYTFQFRGTIPVKGKGERLTYLLIGRKPEMTSIGAVQE